MAGAIYVVTGTDEGMVAEKALKLFEKVRPKGGDEFTNDVVDGTASDSESAFQACARTIEGLQTLPFFGGEKVVWLKGATFLGEDRTGKAERAQEGTEALLEVLKAGIGEDVIFLLNAPTISKVRRFFKWLKDNAILEIYDKIDTSKDGWEQQVAVAVKKQGLALNMSFEREALELFVMLAGEDSRQIKSELAKLDLYLGESRREVTEADVRIMVPQSRAGIVWEISRALEKGDALRALELIDLQLDGGDSAVGIIRAAIIPTVRNLFMARVVMDAIGSLPSNYRSFESSLRALPPRLYHALPQKKAGGISAYPLFLAGSKASRFTLPALRQALSSVLKADEALVTTGLDAKMVLHRLVTELSLLTGKRRS